MKKLLLAALAVAVLAAPTCANPYGKPTVDLSIAPTSGLAREIHDGNWLYTLAWAPAVLAPKADSSPWWPTFHAGIMQGWRADKGDPATGLLGGITVRPIALLIQGANKALHLDGTWKPLAYLANATYTDGYLGYRFIHGPDVHDTVYGVNFELAIAFGNDQIKQGL